MKKIIIKWILWTLALSLVLITILGASQGGIALSPIILAVGLFAGLIGASLHCVIYAYQKGSDRQKISSSVFLIVVISLTSRQVYQESQCSLQESKATDRLKSYIESIGDLPFYDIGRSKFSAEQCTYTFPIKGHPEYNSIIIDERLEIYHIPK